MSDINIEVTKTIEKGIGMIVFPAASSGKPSSAFENSVYRHYPQVKDSYLMSPKRDGDIIANRVKPRLLFCPMICIQGEFSETNQHPLSYHSLETCLNSVRELARALDIPVYIPQFYASPKKDQWEKIEKIINRVSSKFTIWKSEKTIVLR